MAMTDRTLSAALLVVEDDLEAINALYYGRGWTDGLPIVPPTPERVRRMLAWTDRDPDTVLLVVPPNQGEATVETVAIAAVMAGCPPEAMPLLVTAVEALADPAFNLLGVMATTYPSGVLLIANGPLAAEAGLQGGSGALGPGWRANATIGRALRLLLINTGGGEPGKTDKSTLGHAGRFTYALAENERESPWEPLHVTRGLAAEDSAVTILPAEAPHNVNDHYSASAEGVLTMVLGTLLSLGSNNFFYDSEVVVFLSPEHAAVVARDGWSRADVQRFIFERAALPMERWSRENIHGRFRDKYPEQYATADAAKTLIPLVRAPDRVLVVVAGGAGRHSATVSSIGISRAVTRLVTTRDGRPARSLNDFRSQSNA